MDDLCPKNSSQAVGPETDGNAKTCILLCRSFGNIFFLEGGGMSSLSLRKTVQQKLCNKTFKGGRDPSDRCKYKKINLIKLL